MNNVYVSNDLLAIIYPPNTVEWNFSTMFYVISSRIAAEYKVNISVYIKLGGWSMCITMRQNNNLTRDINIGLKSKQFQNIC